MGGILEVMITLGPNRHFLFFKEYDASAGCLGVVEKTTLSIYPNEIFFVPTDVLRIRKTTFPNHHRRLRYGTRAGSRVPETRSMFRYDVMESNDQRSSLPISTSFGTGAGPDKPFW